MSRTSPRRLNRQLTLSAVRQIADGAGGYHESWAPLGTLWADLRALSGRTSAQSGTATSLQRYRITVRAAPVGSAERPLPDQRFEDGTRRFLIQSVAETDSDGRFLTCFAVEEVAI